KPTTFPPSAHTHTFASLTSKPTTISGYGITDFNSLGDARWALRTRTITGTGGLTGGGNLTANRTIDLSSTTKSDIAKGVTAHGWGDFRTFGLGTSNSTFSGLLKDITATRFLAHSSGSRPADSPGTDAGVVLSMQSEHTYYASQLWINRGVSRMYMRSGTRSNFSATGADWVEFWHTGNLANGTTAQYIRGDGSLATYANPYTKSQSDSRYLRLNFGS